VTDVFDVFLSHNSADKPAVRKLAEALRDDRGLTVWLDEWELVPGRPWQEAVEEIIRTVRSSAVLVAADGLGPWEIHEMRACLTQLVRRKLPVIPVLLPGAPNPPDLPIFLGEVTWVDLRAGMTPEGLDRLVWGITGKKPSRHASRPSVWLNNLPYPTLGDLFKGRDAELHSLLGRQVQTIDGLGGMGKTRLAVEHAWRFQDHYTAAFFVRADSPETLRSGLAGLAKPELLDLREQQALPEPELVVAVLRWLREHPGWLLVLDNVDTKEAYKTVVAFLSSIQGGRILITCRWSEWPPEIQSHSLTVLSPEDAARFLLDRTAGKRSPSADDEVHARALSETLGGLPLAMEQAGASISRHRQSFSKYLKAWQEERERVLTWHDETLMRYPDPIVVTWQKTFNQLTPMAGALLRLSAFLTPEPISVAMFEEGSGIVKKAAKLLAKETNRKLTVQSLEEALADLAAYSMISSHQGDSFTVHRMVQEVLRLRVPKDGRGEWIELALRLVNDYSPPEPGDVRTWGVWDPLRSHAAEVISHAEEAEITIPTVRLMSQLALLLDVKGLYAESEPLRRRALAIAETSFGNSHPNVAICLNNLAQSLQATNRLQEAEPLMRRALEIDEASFGNSHPNVAIRLNNLASLLHATDRPEEAEPFMRRALEIDEDFFGKNHPRVATGLNNLAQLLKATNRLAEVEPLMRRALEIDEAYFENNHPSIARDLNNLAAFLRATNRLEEAEPLMRRALEIDEAFFGKRHPNVARDLNNLARLLQDTNRLQEAEPLMRRALEILEGSLGPDHPRTVIARTNLENLLAALEQERAGGPAQPAGGAPVLKS